MADMVLLRCAVGSKAATVLCPKCGRISRQILACSYKTNQVSALIRPHVCPICQTVYKDCNPSQGKNWSSELRQYDQNADAYNKSAKDKYASNNSHKKTASSYVSPATPGSAKVASTSSKEYWYYEVEVDGKVEDDMYISDIGIIYIDTKVVIPFGRNNEERIGTIVAGYPFTEDNAPSPPHLTKHIIRIATEDDLRSKATDSSPAGSVYGNGYTGTSPLRDTKQSTEDMQMHFETVRPASSPAEKVLVPNENLDRKIDRWKRELLDTGKRNRMINYRETKRSTLAFPKSP